VYSHSPHPAIGVRLGSALGLLEGATDTDGATETDGVVDGDWLNSPFTLTVAHIGVADSSSMLETEMTRPSKNFVDPNSMILYDGWVMSRMASNSDLLPSRGA